MRYVAIDVETADFKRDSACSLALVEVNGRLRRTHHFLIRPPRRCVPLTWVHGITWSDLVDKPSFRQWWPRIEPILRRADFFAAHNAAFDMSVLRACTQPKGLLLPHRPVVCTMKLARLAWDLYPTDLQTVSSFIDFDLDHHHAVSDALACAQIVRAAGPNEVARYLSRERAKSHGLLPRRPRGAGGREHPHRRSRNESRHWECRPGERYPRYAY